MLNNIGAYRLCLIHNRNRNRLHVGSNPTVPTMVEKISEYYRSKGFVSLYININKEPRRVATLKHSNGTLTSMSYAKYLYTSYYKIDIEKGYEIDHKNNDKLDDRIDNLQILLKQDNLRKSSKRRIMVERVCPVCGKVFMYRKRDLCSHPNPCCSRKCGGIKSHWKKLSPR